VLLAKRYGVTWQAAGASVQSSDLVAFFAPAAGVAVEFYDLPLAAPGAERYALEAEGAHFEGRGGGVTRWEWEVDG